MSTTCSTSSERASKAKRGRKERDNSRVGFIVNLLDRDVVLWVFCWIAFASLYSTINTDEARVTHVQIKNWYMINYY